MSHAFQTSQELTSPEKAEDCQQLEQKIALRFADMENFGEFCVRLTRECIRFTHAGFQTIVLYDAEVAKLSEASKQHLATQMKKDAVQRHEVARGRGRNIIPPGGQLRSRA